MKLFEIQTSPSSEQAVEEIPLFRNNQIVAKSVQIGFGNRFIASVGSGGKIDLSKWTESLDFEIARCTVTAVDGTIIAAKTLVQGDFSQETPPVPCTLETYDTFRIEEVPSDGLTVKYEFYVALGGLPGAFLATGGGGAVFPKNSFVPLWMEAFEPTETGTKWESVEVSIMPPK